MATRKRVLLVGWDAADWKVIHPLMDAGLMPNVRRLVDNGSMAQIATLQPPLSPMLWTSIATGKRPFQHGIHGFAEPTPDGRGIQPVTNLSRKCKALWNILTQNDLRSIVIGWWPSHPAEPINGVMVSDHFHRPRGPLKQDQKDQGWPLLSGTVYPSSLADTLAELRLHPDELDPQMLLPFIPRAAEIDQEKDHRLASLCKTLCECVSIHSAATWLMDNQEWDFFGVYYDAIDHFSHAFMRYYPPRQEFVPEKDFELYSGVISAAYRFHDEMLGALLRKTDANTHVILMSDHGFHPDHLRPRIIPRIPAGPAIEHRDYGIFAIAGPGIRKDELLHGVSVLDVTPTILNLFGLPAAEDMDGRPLVNAFRSPPEIPPIHSWEDVSGNAGRHPPHLQMDPLAAKEALDQMVALGYIERPDDSIEKAVAATAAELKYNLGQSYQDAGRHAEAYELFRHLFDYDPDEQRFAVHLFISCQALGLTEDMEEIVEYLDGPRRRKYEEALQRLTEITTKIRARAAERREMPRDPESLLDDSERQEVMRLRRLVRFQSPMIDYLRAQVFTARRLWGKALECIERVKETDLARPALFLQTADLCARMHMWETAADIWSRALALDPDNPHAHLGLCRLALHRRNFSDAASHALESLGRLYQNPLAHFYLGIALTGMLDFSKAADAFRAAIALNPNFPQAHLRLGWLLRRRLGRSDLASDHFRAFRELRAGAKKRPIAIEKRTASAEMIPAPLTDLPLPGDEAVIVSGLPRSGTSMIMQMLAAGGLPPLTDGIRQPDEDNPRGYFEFAPVMKMTQGTIVDGLDWFDQAKGKVVKIVAPLLPALPAGAACRIIFIERSLDEILASQGQMLIRRAAKSQSKIDDNPERRARLRDEYIRLLVRTRVMLAGRPATHVLYLDRNAVLSDPLTAAESMNRFLGGSLNTEAMASEVKPELHRQKART